MKKFIKEFKEFIAQGNVIDMAVAVVIGAAFKNIVNSLVNSIIMPLISLLLNGINVTDWKWVIKAAVYDADGKLISGETALGYGVFIQEVIEFFIIAISIFIMLKIVLSFKGRFFKKEEEADEKAEKAEAKETTEDILKDIRNLLTEKNEKE